jgi:hypothetical protein
MASAENPATHGRVARNIHESYKAANSESMEMLSKK